MTGTARYEATKIPEAIKYPRGLSLSGPWSLGSVHWLPPDVCGVRGFPANGHGGPVTPFSHPGPRPEMEPLSKETLRRAALDARKAFVRTLSDADRARLEHRLAQHLTSLFAGVSVVAGYHPLGSEISPLPAMEEARAVGAIVAFPCFSNPAKPFRFLAGDPLEPGPFGIMQPAKRHPAVEPDLVLVPLIAIDGRGNSARPRQGPLRSRARPPEEEQGAADRGRLAASAADRDDPDRRVGRPARRLRLARRDRDLQALRARRSAPSSPALRRDGAHRCRTRR